MKNDKTTGLRVDAIFDDPKNTIKAKYDVIKAIKENGGHGQVRIVPHEQLTGPNSPILIGNKTN